MALVGINPHAGEDGLIGNEELDVFLEAIKIAKSKKIPIEGPLVPDAAFLKENWSKFSVYICPYHDQGLIPFKLVHGHKSGVHITMGLPFIRTSVEHGTAKKLFGKNKAYYESMLEAIKWSIDLAKQNRVKNSILG